ncbi:MAG: PAS domain S-box protein [Vallitaleaceae bacterium]|jgi:PAS domain S-box-containing protein|nr:PAS domain S-box protein [Vallitaleaceae bacterium]
MDNKTEGNNQVDSKERFYRSIIDNFPIGYSYNKIILNEKGEPCDYTIIETNYAYARATGKNEEELIGKNISEVLPEFIEYDFDWIKRFGEIAINGGEKEMELFSAVLNRWFRIKVYSPERGYFITHYQDVTGPKMQFKELRRSRDNIANIIKGTGVGTWEWHIPENVIIINDRWAEIIGYTLEELSPVSFEKWEDLTHPDDLEKAKAQLDKVLKKELDNFDVEIRMKHKNGHWVWLLDRGKVALWTENGKPLEMLGTHTDISELKRIMKETEDGQERYRGLVEHLGAGVVVHAPDSSIIISNNRASELLGLSEDQMRGKKAINPDWKFIREDRTPLPFEDYPVNEVLTNRKAIKNETLGICQANTEDITWVTVNGVPIYDLSGELVEVVISFIDVTEVIEAEVTLRESESRHKAMVAGISDVIGILDSNGIITYKSPNISKWFGWEPEDLVGKNGWFTMHPDDADRTKLAFQKIVSTDHGSETVEYRYRCKDGSYKMVELTATNHLDDAYINGILLNYKDITERQLAEKAIAEERERLAVTLRSIGDGVITTDIEGNVLIMNRVAELLTGWLQEEAMGKPITTVFNVIDESTRLAHENPVKKVLTDGEIIELANHTVLISKDGSERAVADSGAPIRNRNSEIIGVVLVFRDMTEKQKLLSNMQRIDKLDSLGILAGGIAHDFNNLLGGIFGYIDMARMSCNDSEKALGYLDKALSVFDRAKDLTQQLLTFSKGGVPKRTTGQIGYAIKKNATFVLSGTNINSEFIIAKDLWLCDFDKYQIGQVIDNMLINALQAMPNGGTVTIAVNNKYIEDGEIPIIPNGKYIEITIKDEGEGIDKKTLKYIFDPFFSTKQKGNGLGLATCYSIIQKHEGFIEVESQVGKGSSFHIYLPASEQK